MSETGATPVNLVADDGGNLYGTTSGGGAYGFGTAFEIAHGTGTIRTLVSFRAADGGSPTGSLTLDSSGNLYGATGGGGNNGYGTVFEILRGAATVRTLGSFNYTNGAYPAGRVAVDASGNVYGTTGGGGPSGVGTVFRIMRGTNAIQTLASFAGANGANPYGGVTLDSEGNLYGTTKYGGAFGYGSIFKLSKDGSAFQTVASFRIADGINPYSGVTLDASGNLYGTTIYGGAFGDGTVFRLNHVNNSLEPIASFHRTNGALPDGGVTLDAAGNLYGTTTLGGAYGYDYGGTGYGTVWKIPHGGNTIQTLLSFNSANGLYPHGSVVVDSEGNVFGTASAGGDAGAGTAFKLSPPVPGDVNGDRSVSFADLLTLAQHYGRPGTADEGDLNDNGSIGFDDLLILAQNYGRYEPAGWTSQPSSTSVTAFRPAESQAQEHLGRRLTRRRASLVRRLGGAGKNQTRVF